MNKSVFAIGLLLMSVGVQGVTHEKLMQTLSPAGGLRHPFSYDLGVTVIPSKQTDANVMICMHGMGGDYNIIQSPHYARTVRDHLVSFNFPDYRCMRGPYDPECTSFGTIDELLPPLFIIKKCVIDGGMQAINLYGFSAGGGAVINILGILRGTRFSSELAQLGITSAIKKRMLDAICRGIIILDCPLKTVEEIIDVRGESYDLEIFAKRYRENKLRPLDALEYLKHGKFTILLYFNDPDEILSNRDDAIFVKRLREYNGGTTRFIVGKGGGHNSNHPALWNAYAQMCETL